MTENQTDTPANSKQEIIDPTSLALSEQLGEPTMDTEGKYMTFTLQDQVYGIEIRDVREIVDLQQITKVPGVPEYIKGLINLRGQVIPVLDVRLRFGVAAREYDSRTCIIVVEFDETMVGLIVDRVADVLIIPEDRIQAPPSSNNGESSQFIKGLGKIDNQVKILLDTEKLIARSAMPS